jgi:ATP-dependent DNA helicase RecG
MKPSLTKLQKFFSLEADRGYDNHAVVGGLERMLDRWEAEARLENVPEDLIRVVKERLRDYNHLSKTSRAEVLEGLMRRISREDPSQPITSFDRNAKSKRPFQNARPHQPREAPGRPSETGQAPKPSQLQEAQGFTAPGAGNALSHEDQASPEIQPAGATDTTGAEDGEPEDTGESSVMAHEDAIDEIVTGMDNPSAESNLEGIDTGDLQEEAGYSDEGDESPTPSDDTSEVAPYFKPPAREIAEVPKDPAALSAPVTVLNGVGPQHGATLGRLGMKSLRDMLYYLPRRYDDYSKLKPINRLWYGEEVTVIGTIKSVNTRRMQGGKRQITEAILTDGSGALRLTWFSPYAARRLRPGSHISVSGKIDQYLGRLVITNPEWEPIEHQQLSTNRIVPVYPLTAQITQRWLRRLMYQVVMYWAPRIPDPLPPDLRSSAGLMDLSSALVQLHFPDSAEALRAARHRLAFDEIFLLQLGVLRQKRHWQDRAARTFQVEDTWLQSQVERLPYQLTGAQQRSLNDLRQDLVSGRPMNRLLQGDVGSGKTVIAMLAIAIIVQNGAQAALMAPTSILAEQHYKTMLRYLTGPEGGESGSAPLMNPGEIRLMVGATPEAEKRVIRAGLDDGSIRLVIGTHALIEDPVSFADLQLTVVDEQHRFGVEQRAALRAKGDNPHLLVMTATPIPRSLALTVYGDLDLSIMDEMPPGRQPISTHVLPPRERERAFHLIRSQVALGRQAFIIYPLVEETENSEAKAAVEGHASLQKEVFPKLKLGLLHGRMRPDDKDEVMKDFRDGKYHVLVSTSVVEVGVDVPNATVMIIEGANHFGLAQLHQFRGRVGRGAEKSYCLLIPDTPDSVENQRLQAMVETNDGFVLAERDLDLRGPGQFLGTRQSGYSELQLAKLTDVRLIEKARIHAQAVFEQDPNLESPAYRLLSTALHRFWGDPKGDIS